MAFDGLVHLAIVEMEGERRRRNEVRIIHRQLRDTSNPFNLPDKLFLKLFRLNKQCSADLIQMLEQHLVQRQKVTGIPVHLKVLTALHFFGHGSYQLGVGHIYSFALSQPSVSRSIAEVSDSITTHLLQRWIRFPHTEETRAIKKQHFNNIEQRFPDLIGVIDCTHIRIVAPPAEHPVYPGAVYYCRKHFFAINTQIICDAERKIININARFPGSVHDSAIWMMSQAKAKLQNQYVRTGQLNYLIGDSGYPLEPWLLTPFAEVVPHSPEASFNTALSKLRTIIEHVNGMLKARFRCTHGHRALHYDPIRAAKIIYSCAVLHNMCREYNIPLPDDDEPPQQQEHINHPPNLNMNGQDWYNTGNQIRQDIVNDHFHN